MLNCFFAIEVCVGNGAVLWVFDVRVCDAITARYMIFRVTSSETVEVTSLAGLASSLLQTQDTICCLHLQVLNRAPQSS